MNWDRVETNWLAHSASAQQRWNILTEKDLLAIGGERDKLIIFLQEFQGFSQARAEFEVEAWRRELSDTATLVAANNHAQTSKMPSEAGCEKNAEKEQGL